MRGFGRAAYLVLPIVFAFVFSPMALAASTTTQASNQKQDRLFVFSTPGLTWADVASHDLPHLEGFFRKAALADLAPRGVEPTSGPGDAYLTMSAGARSTTKPFIDGQILPVDAKTSGSSVGEIFARRTGVAPRGDFVAINWPVLVSANEQEPYDAVPGLLATTLARQGIGVTVIGNADGSDSGNASYERQVGLALANASGVVIDGSLGTEILQPDPAASFGVRLDEDAVLESFDQAWSGLAKEPADGMVALVEASDLARTLRYQPMVGTNRYNALWSSALTQTDRMFGRMMTMVNPQRDSVLVVAPYNQEGKRDLTVVALAMPNSEPGYLQSASTQRSGFLTLVDIAPTVLGTFEVNRPLNMEGRSAEVSPSSASLDERIDHLVSLNEASIFRERLLVPTTVAIVLIVALVEAGTIVVLAGRKGSRLRRLLAHTALAVLAAFPASYLARAFKLEDLGLVFYWGFLLLTLSVIVGLAWMVSQKTAHPRSGLVLVLSVMAGVLIFDAVTGSRLSLSAAFGYSPTGNSRLYGISNYSFGQLSTAICLLAAILAARSKGLRGRGAAFVLLVATLVVLGVPIWGSDVGGVLAFTPTILVFAALVLRRRIRWRTVVAGAAATALAVTVFGLLDLARPPGQRAHLGRLFERLSNEGLGPLFSIIERKLLANLQVSVSSFWVAAIPVALALWIFLIRFPTRPIEAVRNNLPTLGAGLGAAVLAAGLGTIVNDSGAIVGGVAAAVIAPALAYLVLVEPSAAER